MAHEIIRDRGKARCGNPGGIEAHIESGKHTQSQKEAFRASGGLARIQTSSLAVDLYIHVIAGSTSQSDGYLTQEDINSQFAVLQTTYAPTGINFNLKNTSFIVNSDWVSRANNPNTEDEWKRELHQGDYRTINLYIVKNFWAYGRCPIPVTEVNVTQPDRLLLDGCTIESDTIPGGAETNINEGKTATHEIGHWFGLWHTFESHGRIAPNPPSGCVGIGDEVDDTPAEDTMATGCMVGRNTCANLEGDDPIHNYMDYSDDSCMTEFTPGQVERMFMIWENYRAIA